MTIADESELDSLARTLRSTGNFVYANSHRLILVSVCWFVASLPLVTIGPATLAAYVAIRHLDSPYNRIDWGDLVSTVRQQFVASALFGLFPLSFLGLCALYLRAYVVDGSTLAAAIAFVTFYVALYAFLVMVPTFVRLAEREQASVAIRWGVSWVGAHPTLALLTGVVTLVTAVVTAVLTIAFVLIFAGAAFSFQIQMIDATEPTDADEDHTKAGAVGV